MFLRDGFVKMAGFQVQDWSTSQLIRSTKYATVGYFVSMGKRRTFNHKGHEEHQE
jgi:hypothetical protein